jgi:hypothetical protein
MGRSRTESTKKSHAMASACFGVGGRGGLRYRVWACGGGVWGECVCGCVDALEHTLRAVKRSDSVRSVRKVTAAAEGGSASSSAIKRERKEAKRK